MFIFLDVFFKRENEVVEYNNEKTEKTEKKEMCENPRPRRENLVLF